MERDHLNTSCNYPVPWILQNKGDAEITTVLIVTNVSTQLHWTRFWFEAYTDKKPLTQYFHAQCMKNALHVVDIRTTTQLC